MGLDIGGGVLQKTMGVLFALISVFVVLTVAAELLPDVLTSITGIVDALNNGSTNSTLGDAILTVGVILVPVVVVLGTIFIILRAAGIQRG